MLVKFGFCQKGIFQLTVFPLWWNKFMTPSARIHLTSSWLDLIEAKISSNHNIIGKLNIK